MASSLGSTMKAAIWKGNAGGMHKNLSINASAPLPKNAKSLPKDHTLVKVSYASINPVDYKLPELPLMGGIAFSSGTPGLDFAGTIVESTLAHLKPGEPVFGKTEPPAFGSVAEYLVVGKQGCCPIPNGVKLEDAATVGVCGLTALQTLAPFLKDKPAGAKVFLNGGSGGVGTYQIQIAKAMGCHVTTTCSGANVDLCKSLGAEEVIDYRTTDVVAHLSRQGTQYDHIVDNVFNSADLYWSCHKYLKPGCQYVTIAGSAEFATVRNILSIFLWPGFLGGGQRKFGFVMANSDVLQYEQIAKWMKEGKVKPVIEQVFGMEDVGKAYERLKTGRTRGKLVIKVGA